MILCVNANAAIDKTVVVRNFRLDVIQRPEGVRLSPGGKGCNVARALKRLGATPVVTGWVGGYAGAFITDGLAAERIETAFIQVAPESRTCLSIVDPDNATLTELYERGEPIEPVAVDRLKRWFGEKVGAFEAVVLSGSLPPGVPRDLYAELITMARARGVFTGLDTSGEALAQAIAAGPDLIKPNAHEFEELLGHPLGSDSELAVAAREWAERTGGRVVVSLGSAGALAAGAEGVWLGTPPPIVVVSAVGSGDSLVAGCVLGLTRGLSLAESLRCGVAAGTANALSLGAAQFTLEAYQQCLSEVRIQPLA